MLAKVPRSWKLMLPVSFPSNLAALLFLLNGSSGMCDYAIMGPAFESVCIILNVLLS